MRKVLVIFLALFFFIGSDSYARSIIYFAHGLGGFRSNVKNYQFPEECKVSSFNFTDAENNYRDKSLISAGQDNDIGTLIKNIKDNPGQVGDSKILMGVSRGAICISNLFNKKIQKKFKHSELLRSISGIILESPAAHIRDGVKLRLKKIGIGWIPFLGWGVDKLFVKNLFFGSYNASGPHPIYSVQEIPKDLPVLFVCVENDNQVPTSSTIKLAYELVRSKHKHVYLWMAKQGIHANIFCDEYKRILNAFIKKCSNNESYDEDTLHEIKYNYDDPGALKKLHDLKKRLTYTDWKNHKGRNIITFLAILSIATLTGLHLLS